MTKKLLPLLLLFVSLTASALAWQSAQWNLSFTEPKGWTEHTSDNMVMFLDPNNKGGIGVKVEPSNGTELTAESIDAAAPYVGPMFEKLYKAKLLGLRAVTVNGKNMMKMSLIANQGEKIQITGYVATYKGKMYTFVLSSDQANHSSLMPYLDAVVNSAKFL